MSKNQINTFVHVVDYLAVSPAQTPNFGPVAMITVRHDPGNSRPHVDQLGEHRAQPGSFAPHNLALTVDQARKLRDDLNHIFSVVPCFKEVTEEATEVKPKRRRRRRRKNEE